MSAPLTHTITLPRDAGDLVVTLQPLPLGFHRRLLARGLAPPEPPTVVARDARGQVVRDDRGLAVLQASAYDAAYLASKASYEERLAVLMLRECLTDDALLIDPLPAESAGAETWATFADQQLAALSKQGVTAGEFVRLCRGVSEASGLIDASYDRAVDGLFPPAADGCCRMRPTCPKRPAASTTSCCEQPNVSA